MPLVYPFVSFWFHGQLKGIEANIDKIKAMLDIKAPKTLRKSKVSQANQLC